MAHFVVIVSPIGKYVDGSVCFAAIQFHCLSANSIDVNHQTMSHIVESCPQSRLHGGLSKLHSADDDAVAWLSSYGY